MPESLIAGVQTALQIILVIGNLVGAGLLLANLLRGPRRWLAHRAGETTVEQALSSVQASWADAPIIDVRKFLFLVLGIPAAAIALLLLFQNWMNLFPALLLGVLSFTAIRAALTFIQRTKALSAAGLAGRETLAALARPVTVICFGLLYFGAGHTTLLLSICAYALLSITSTWIAYEESSSVMYFFGLIGCPAVFSLSVIMDIGGLPLQQVAGHEAATDAIAAMVISALALVLVTLARAPTDPATMHPDLAPTVS